MNDFKLTLFSFLILTISTSPTFCQNNDKKDNWNNLITGKWVNRINIDSNEREYLGLKCKDTIEYFIDCKYEYKGCEWNASGKWKFSDDYKHIIHYNIKSAYWSKILETDSLGEMHSPIISLTDKELVTTFFTEDKGKIKSYSVKIK